MPSPRISLNSFLAAGSVISPEAQIKNQKRTIRRLSRVVAVLASINGEKPTFLAVCGKEAVQKGIKAGELVKLVCSVCGGSGGGKPDSAMGGGKDPIKVDNALALVDDFVAEKI